VEVEYFALLPAACAGLEAEFFCLSLMFWWLTHRIDCFTQLDVLELPVHDLERRRLDRDVWMFDENF